MSVDVLPETSPQVSQLPATMAHVPIDDLDARQRRRILSTMLVIQLSSEKHLEPEEFLRYVKCVDKFIEGGLFSF
jgi:thiamine monophosphate synthase